MILAIHGDASYLSEAAALSQAQGHFFCFKDSKNLCNNGAVHNVSKILKAVMSSAAKAELGALYINACKAVPMCQLLKEMGHKQPKTPIKTDQQQHPTATYKGHGQAFPLAMLSQITKPIQVLLVTRNQQPSQLLDQASLRSSPHRKAQGNSHSKIHT
jgi:hypothetical protein